MPEYRNVKEIMCSKIEENKWTCEIIRQFTEPKRVSDSVCYQIKAEKEKDIEHIGIKGDIIKDIGISKYGKEDLTKILFKEHTKCSIQEGAEGLFMKCESEKP